MFSPGKRLRMNAVPMFLNLLAPWVTFTVCCGLTSFWLLYREPQLVTSMLALFALCWLFLVAAALYARRKEAEPTWLTYAAAAVGVALLTGTKCGLDNYAAYSRPFYAIRDLKGVHQIDAGRELGQDVLDAGVMYFADGNHLDPLRSWHFKDRTLYCVAPVVSNGSAPLTHSYDYWAVGKDCCSTTTSDFRCGPDWASAATRAGIRVLDESDLVGYRLAVKQAEALYGVLAAHPIFLTWAADPLGEVNSWRAQALRNFAFLNALAFCVFLLGVLTAGSRYAWLGRARSAYAMDFYCDPQWKNAHQPGRAGGPTQARCGPSLS